MQQMHAVKQESGKWQIPDEKKDKRSDLNKKQHPLIQLTCAKDSKVYFKVCTLFCVQL